MNNLVWFFAFVGFVSSYPFKGRFFIFLFIYTSPHCGFFFFFGSLWSCLFGFFCIFLSFVCLFVFFQLFTNMLIVRLWIMKILITKRTLYWKALLLFVLLNALWSIHSVFTILMTRINLTISIRIKFFFRNFQCSNIFWETTRLIHSKW